ncbi:MAG: porin [Nitrospiraceae bacterium]|nr:porin [Nitrospiraceae bacterium]
MDEYSEYPVGKGSIATEAAYFDYNTDTPLNPRIKAWYAQAGYLLPGKIGPGRLQPAIRYDTCKPDDNDTATKAWSAGLNYYIKGHNVAIQIEYLNISNEANASQNLGIFSGIKGKDTDAITVQLSLII